WQASSTAAAATAGSGTGGSDSGSGERDDPPDRLWPALQPMAREVLAEFVASREREGARLAAAIVGHVEEMQSVVRAIEPLIPELLAGAEARLIARLEEAMPKTTNGIPAEETFARIRQEV